MKNDNALNSLVTGAPVTDWHLFLLRRYIFFGKFPGVRENRDFISLLFFIK